MLTKNQIKLFRIVALLEGLSYLALLGIAVPLKYLAGNDVLVKALGMPHGLLFMAYLLLLGYWFNKTGWSTWMGLKMALASILPFGTLVMDKHIKQLKAQA